jgi:CDP-diacylglycerol--glycerol-3-phosphate 3-phosphatidyltransferase
VLDPIAERLASWGVPATAVTVMGVVLSAFGGLAFAGGSFRLAGLLCLVAGLCDTIDGAIARRSDSSSRLGAFVDSVSDRYAEILMLAGLLWFYAVRSPSPSGQIGVFLALTGSLLVSYTKARAEGLGAECSMGLMERPERMVVIIVAALLGTWIMIPALWLLGFLAHATSVQRIRYIYRSLRNGSDTSAKGD